MRHSPVVFLSVVAVTLLSHSVLGQMELCKALIQECKRDEFVVGDKRMILFSKEKKWTEARDHCERIGMRLLTTTTKKEVDELAQYLNTRRWEYRPDISYWNLWLSLTSLDPEGVWTWQTTKQSLNSTYTSYKGEPYFRYQKNCMELTLILIDETYWNDVSCNDRRRYICEVEDLGLN